MASGERGRVKGQLGHSFCDVWVQRKEETAGLPAPAPRPSISSRLPGGILRAVRIARSRLCRTGTRLGLGLGQRAPRKSRQIATLRPPPQQNPERRERSSRESLFLRARRAHLPRRSDARCLAGRTLSRPAASEGRAQVSQEAPPERRLVGHRGRSRATAGLTDDRAVHAVAGIDLHPQRAKIVRDFERHALSTWPRPVHNLAARCTASIPSSPPTVRAPEQMLTSSGSRPARPATALAQHAEMTEICCCGVCPVRRIAPVERAQNKRAEGFGESAH